jgi:multidrug efflux pump
MAKFTDIFIRRPVLATVISLLILIFGLRAGTELQVREYPKMENTVITVTTVYPGASAEVVKGFVTTILEKSIASAEGIDYMTSTSTDNVSIITAYIKLNFDPNAAFTDIMSKVAQVRGNLPSNSKEPIIQKETGESTDLMYVSFSSDQMSAEQITDYITRAVVPKLETVSGVSKAEILGAKTFAMRIWLNPQKMAALSITPIDVSQALLNNNFQSTAGKISGEWTATSVDATTGLQTPQGFGNIIIRANREKVIRLKDVADVELGAADYDTSVIFNGKPSIFIGINSTPTANPLTVIQQIRKILPSIEQGYPPSLSSKIVYDATIYIKASIRDVLKTIVEASIIVLVVIFLFLGSLRTVLIPIITIPLSLIGVLGIMLLLGYSINVLTLLALVLAIGMVVDDAIVVVENIYRHIEEGLAPFQAALNGAREIAIPIISLTITLAAVYAPIGLMGGITGALFTEFAFTLAGSVILSGVIALTLSPMMASKILNHDISQNKLVHYIDTTFDKLKNFYLLRLRLVLNYRPVTIVFALIVLLSCVFLYATAQQELAPEEDQGVLFVMAQAPQYANLHYVETYTNQINKIFTTYPAVSDYFTINFPASAMSGVILKPWDERSMSQRQLNTDLQPKLKNSIAGLRSIVYPLPSLPVGGSPLQIQFALNTVQPFEYLYPYATQMEQAAQKSGLFIILNSSLTFDKPQIHLQIDRDKAAQLGVNMANIGNTLAVALGGNSINQFNMGGLSYDVIPQLGGNFRFTPESLKQIYISTVTGKLVPLSTFISITEASKPNALTSFQQLNSATLSGMMMPGHTIAEGLKFLQDQAAKILPASITYDYAGLSRQYIQEGSALIYTFIFSIIIIFLVLAAQFESFRDPFIILITVPLSICGALIPINMGFATINIYTQIGLITLIGLITKHGILMVEFANTLQREEGLSIRDAIEKAASIRLRPILMTTAAMVVGVVPLLIATGAGAVSRFNIGLVIAFGMLIGTLFTLFVIPTMYTLLARKHQPMAH